MITLQINTSGAWKNMFTFQAAQRDAVLRSVASLAGILGPHTTWALLHADGRRDHLLDIDAPQSAWAPVTPTEPEALKDVMVSVFGPGDDEPVVFMAYRKPDARWYISGMVDQVIDGVYAFAEIIGAAPSDIDGGVVSGSNRTTSGGIGQS